jgi:hypothetical protein
MRRNLKSKDNFSAPAQHELSPAAIRTLIYLLLITLSLIVLITISGVSFINSTILCMALIIQWFPGAVVWTWINRNNTNSLAEFVGMGLAVGSLLALLSSQIFRTTSLQRFGWAIPCVVVGFVHFSKLIRGSKYNYTLNSLLSLKQRVITILPTLLLAIIQLSTWWRWHPTAWQGWWKFNVDTPYFDSYSNSIAILGTTQSLMNPDLNTRYHWFTYAWVGSLSNSLNIDTFIVLTRLLPIITFCMAATITYAWSKDYSKNFWTPVIASLVITIGPGLSVGSYVMLRSPSQAMAGGWCLAFSLLLFGIVKGRFTGVRSYFLLGLLAAGVVGGKGSNLLIVGTGVFALLLTTPRQIQTVKIRIWISALLSLSVFFAVYQQFISSSESRALGIGVFLGWPGLILTILPTSIGIYGLYKNRISNHDSLFIYSVAVFIAGLLLSLFTYDSAGDQIYFMISAGMVCVVPSLIGIERMIVNQVSSIWIDLRSVSVRQIYLVLPSLTLFGGMATAFIWSNVENSDGNLAKVARTLAPSLLFITATLVVIFAGLFVRFNGKEFTGHLKVLFLSLLTASIVASVSGILLSTQNGPIYSGSSGIAGFGKSTKGTPGSISLNYINAGKWVQENINETNLFFTNRQCIDAESSYDDCNGYWFYASALTKHQFLIEGAALNDFKVKDKLKMSKEQALSYRFSLTPNRDDLETLWASNVRWGWIDRQVSDISDWKGLANEIYSNPDIAIIELTDPKIELDLRF